MVVNAGIVSAVRGALLDISVLPNTIGNDYANRTGRWLCRSSMAAQAQIPSEQKETGEKTISHTVYKKRKTKNFLS